MNTFVFENKQRTLFLGMILVGVICMAMTWFGDDAIHSRFWSNFLHNTVFFTGISFIALFAICAFITAYAGWYVSFKRVFEAFSLFLIIGLILFLVIIAGLWGHLHHLYHWSELEAVAADPILQHKAPFLNKYWYALGTIVILAVWYFLFALPLRRTSIAEDSEQGVGFKRHRRMRVYAAVFLPIAGFTSAALVWLWVMSVDAHWYSTLFAWYCTASWFVSMMCLTVITLIWLHGKGYFPYLRTDHIHDIGKYIFAFSIFWTYLWFSQYMLIWYGNVGEETIYYSHRLDEYPVLFYANLLINFVLPFFVLMRNDTKRKFGTMLFISMVLLFGHWLDFFLMLKPGILHTAHEVLGHGHHAAEAASTIHDAAHHGAHGSSSTPGFTMPGLLELGTFIGFLGLFFYCAFTQLAKTSLYPKNDPYLAESLHHHV